MNVQRRKVEVQGIVQGVGFRPYVRALAAELGLAGFVRNEAGRVVIEVEGDRGGVDEFLFSLPRKAPPLARVEHVRWETRTPVGDVEFRIDSSSAGASADVFISPDAATCTACVAELFDPRDRRYHYPFLNCTDCGPRLTIIEGAPYDRERTTMRTFEMCAACKREYEDPSDRRFHAQPMACPRCGPHVRLVDGRGAEIKRSDAIAALADLLLDGWIAAVKGLGGYHLACDAMSESAVAVLRRRKGREEKPFAVMANEMAQVERWCEVADAERALLLSPRAPIVLLRKKQSCEVAEGVAPGNPSLGVMAPYTPLHHLLMRAFGDIGGRALVMTSGNRTDEPIAIDDDDALSRLAGIADVFLVHNRPIHVRCDDSVVRVVEDADRRVLLIRRSRGYAPEPVTLPTACPVPTLAVGGQLKNTFALGRDRHAFISHYMGDLDHYEAYRTFVRDIGLYEDLFSIKPEVIVHDAHPDYASTRYALDRGRADGAITIAVQHHHAHMASCMAEHGLAGPVIGVTFDGTGYGEDGTVWGGEFLIGDCATFVRAAHLRPVAMPGGEQAVREPWRMAAAHLIDAGVGLAPLEDRFEHASLKKVERMIERDFNCPMTSSAGRLFDAVASLCGTRDRVAFEGQAAIELEWQAESAEIESLKQPFPLEVEGLPHAWPEISDWRFEAPLVIDTRPLIRALVDELDRKQPVPVIARRFHLTLAAMIAEVCCRLAARTGVTDVVLSGGVFMNVLLLRETRGRLTNAALRVFCHEQVPPSDGGLCLGQLAVAANRLSKEEKELNVPGHSRSSR